MKTIETPIVKVVKFQAKDVITTSDVKVPVGGGTSAPGTQAKGMAPAAPINSAW